MGNLYNAFQIGLIAVLELLPETELWEKRNILWNNMREEDEEEKEGEEDGNA